MGEPCLDLSMQSFAAHLVLVLDRIKFAVKHAQQQARSVLRGLTFSLDIRCAIANRKARGKSVRH